MPLPFGIGETEVTVQLVAYIVSVQQHGVMRQCVKLLQDIRYRRLARSGKAGKPQHAGTLVSSQHVCIIERLPANILASPQRIFDHARAQPLVSGQSVCRPLHRYRKLSYGQATDCSHQCHLTARYLRALLRSHLHSRWRGFTSLTV